MSNKDLHIAALHIPLALPDPRPPMSLAAAVDYAVAAMRGGPADDLPRAFEQIDEDAGGAYRQVLGSALECKHVSSSFREAFHLNWTVRGFRHRADVQDDDLILDAFRSIFPTYQGPALVLYRGERASEMEAGRLGLNWSPEREVAQRFAAGLCRTYGCDGVLLTATAPAVAIISGPNDHSANWLCEFEHIVAPRMLIGVREIARVPPLA